MVVIRLLRLARPFFWVVVVFWLGFIFNNLRQQAQFLLEAVVQTRLHRRHYLELALQQSERGPYWSLTRHVTNLHVRRGCEPSSLVHNSREQLIQDV